MDKPNADDASRAIVAACYQTGEDPIAVATGTAVKSRARHYAIAALRLAFPKADQANNAKLVGCTGDGFYFYKNSRKKTQGKAKWWNASVLAIIVEAVRTKTDPKRGDPVKTPSERLQRLKEWAQSANPQKMVAPPLPSIEDGPKLEMIEIDGRRAPRATFQREARLARKSRAGQDSKPAAAAPKVDEQALLVSKQVQTRAVRARAIDARVKTAAERQADAERWRASLPDVAPAAHRAEPKAAAFVIDEATGKRRLVAHDFGAPVSMGPPPKVNPYAFGASKPVED